MKLQFGVSPTSVKLKVKLLDSTSMTGAGLTGLVFNSTGLIISVIGDTASTATAYTTTGGTIETITTIGTYAAPTATKCRFKEVDATNHKGIYEIQFADSVFTNYNQVTLSISGATNLAQYDAEIQCSNQAANMTQVLGTAVSTPATAGVLDVNVKNMNNVAATSITTINANIGQTQPLNFTGTGAAALVKTDMVDIAGAAVSTSTAQIGVNAVQIGAAVPGSATIGTVTNLTNAATAGDLTATMKTSVTTAATAATPTAAAVTGNVGGNVVGSVGSVATNGITDASFASATTTKALRIATAQTGAAGSITLDASASSVNDFYDGNIISIASGTGAGQSKIIASYVGATKVATITENWATNPDATSVFVISRLGDVEVGVNNDKTGYSLAANQAVNVTQVDGSALSTHTAGMFPSDLRNIVGAAVSATLAQLGVNVVNMNGVAATAITTINANQGTTQPINFTGTAGSALTKSDVVDIAGAAVSTSTAQLGVNIVQITADATSASNLKAQFDGTTGVLGNTFPSRQDQLSTIASTGAATNVTASTWTNLSTPVATTETGGVNNTVARDATYDVLTNASQACDSYYEFNIGGKGVPTGVSIYGSSGNGGGRSTSVFAWNWISSAWVQVGTMAVQAAQTPMVQSNFALYTTMVGTGANLGKVRIRFLGSSTSTVVTIDQFYVAYATVNNSVGYLDGAVWIDTNNGTAGTTLYVNGTADKPCLTLADALTIATALGVKRLYMLAGSNITLSADMQYWHLDGCMWYLNTNSKDISGTLINKCEGITGGFTTSIIESAIRDSHLGAMTLNEVDVHDCALTDTIVIGEATSYFFDQCFGVNIGAGFPVLDFGSAIGASGIIISHWAGNITIKNMKAGDVLEIDGNGDLTIDSTCTAGSVYVSGGIRLTNNGSGQTIIDTSRWNEDQNITNVTGNVTGSVGSVAANGITSTSIATDAINAASVKADAVTKIQNGLATPTNITAGTITNVTNLTNAATAGDLTTAMKTSVENAVWDATTAAHQTTGTTGKALTNAASAGDPWGTALPGSYGAGTAGKILGDNLNAKVGDVKTQTDKMVFTSVGKIDATAVTVSDKTGYALTSGEHTSIQSDAATGVLVTPANKISTNASNQVVSSSVQGNVTGSVASVTGSVGSVAGSVGGNVTGSVGSIASNGVTSTSIATDAINAASIKADAVTKIQNGLATPTNITAGTITNVTNLTNAPTAGDFTATMKTSLNSSTPASITGSVGSVTGNVGGSVVGSVASVTGSVGSVVAGVTVTTNNDKTGYALTSGEHTSIQTDVANGVLVTPANKIATNASNQVVSSSVQGNVTGSVASVTGAVGSVSANGITSTSIAADAINAASVKADAVTKIQNGLATPTNITAGTITNVTNLTNAPTAGDFTTAMKSSLNASTPASVTGSVGSVTSTVTVGTNNDKTGYALTSAYDAAKTASTQASVDAITLDLNTITINQASQATLSNQTTMLSDLGTIIADLNTITIDVLAIPTTPLLSSDTRLNNLDATISSRLATAGYTAPDNADILLIKAKTDNLPASPAAVGSAMTLTSAYDAAKTASTQASVDAIALDLNTITINQADQATLANQITMISDLDSISLDLNTLSIDVAAIPVNPLLTNDSRLNNLDATISSRAVPGSNMNLASSAITSAKFDNSTAFPVTLADSGSTLIARTGADGDTLKTISDQEDASLSAIQAIQNNTRFVGITPSTMLIPNSGTRMYEIKAFFYDDIGNMEDPDSGEISAIFTAINGTLKTEFYDDAAGTTAATASSTFINSYKMVRISTGEFATYYKLPDTETLDQWIMTFNLKENTIPMVYGRTTQVSNESVGTATLADSNTNKTIIAKALKDQNVSSTTAITGSIEDDLLDEIARVYDASLAITLDLNTITINQGYQATSAQAVEILADLNTITVDLNTLTVNVNAIPTNPLLANDSRIDEIVVDLNTITLNQADQATLANQTTMITDLSEIIADLNTLTVDVNAIPVNPLLTNDSRLNNLNATISSRAVPGDAMTLTALYDAAKTAASQGSVDAIALDLNTITINQASQATLANQNTMISDLNEILVDLNTITVDINAIPVNPLLTNDSRLNNLDTTISSRATQLSVDNITIDLNTITLNQADQATLANQTTMISDLNSIIIDLNTITVDINAIPVNPLLDNDSRLNNLDATISSRLATAGYTAPDNADILLIKAKTDNLPASPAAVGDAMTLTSAYDAAKIAATQTSVDAITLDLNTITINTNDIASQIWDATLSSHLISGSTGSALNSAGSTGDPWNTAVPGVYGAGTAGKILGDNLNAKVGDVLNNQINTIIPDLITITANISSIPVNPLLDNDSRITTMLSDLDEIKVDLNTITIAQGDQATVANQITMMSDLNTITADLNTITVDINAIPTNPLLTNDSRLNNLDATISSRLATAGYTAPDNADILLIKAKTDNLPASPAATGDAMTLTSAYDAAKTAASQSSVNAIPTNPLLTTDPRIDEITLDLNTITLNQADQATLANQVTMMSGIDEIKADLNTLTIDVLLIPTTPLLDNDSRLNNLDATISSRLASASYTAPDNADILLIKAKTDNLPASPAATGDAMILTSAYDAAKTAASQTSVDAIALDLNTITLNQADQATLANQITMLSDLDAIAIDLNTITIDVLAIPVNPLLDNDSRLNNLDATISSRLATASYTAPDNADILLIKAKTDNLPAQPAATGDAMTLTSAYDAAKTASTQSSVDAISLDLNTITINTTDISHQVWDEPILGHTISGSTGAALNAAGSLGDPWETGLPGLYAPGTAGSIIGNNLNAKVGDVLSNQVDVIMPDLVTITANIANIPTTPLLSTDPRIDEIVADLNTITITQLDQATLANQVTMLSGIDEIKADLNTITVDVLAIPTNPLLTNDSRLNNLDATISSRAIAGDAMTLTSAYDAAKTASSQSSVNAIPTNPLLDNDSRITTMINDLDAIQADLNTITVTQLDQATLANQITMLSGLDEIKADLVTITTDILAIPVNPLLTNDSRLNNLDATISSRAIPGDAMILTSAYDAAKTAATQASVNAIPTNPLLTNDSRITTILSDLDSISIDLNTITVDVNAIPTNPLLTNDSRITTMINDLNAIQADLVTITVTQLDQATVANQITMISDLNEIKADLNTLTISQGDQATLANQLTMITDLNEIKADLVTITTDVLEIPTNPLLAPDYIAPDNANILNIWNLLRAGGNGDAEAIKLVTDKLNTMLQVSGVNWTYTMDALKFAPLAGGDITIQTIRDAFALDLSTGTPIEPQSIDQHINEIIAVLGGYIGSVPMTVHVQDAGGAPIIGAYVQAFDSTIQTMQTAGNTNVDGDLSITLNPGNYSILVSKQSAYIFPIPTPVTVTTSNTIVIVGTVLPPVPPITNCQLVYLLPVDISSVVTTRANISFKPQSDNDIISPYMIVNKKVIMEYVPSRTRFEANIIKDSNVIVDGWSDGEQFFYGQGKINDSDTMNLIDYTWINS